MNDELLNALRPLLSRLVGLIPADPALRGEIAAAARAVAHWLEPEAKAPAPPTSATPIVTAPAAAPIPPTAPATPTAPPTPIESLPPLTFHLPLPAPSRPRLADDADHPPGKEPPASPAVIAARCRLKAEACKLLATSGYDPTALATRELLAKSDALHNCQLWMLLPGDYNTAAAAWADLVAAYDAAAVAADLLAAWNQSPAEPQARTAEEVLHLVAEAQSTLLSATVGVGRWAYDQDQLEIYLIVAAETKARRVYVRRYLRREDRADPTKAPDVKKRLNELLAQVKSTATGAVNRKKLLSSLKFKLGKLAADRAGNADEWPLVLDILDKLVADGVPPSNPDMRDPLLLKPQPAAGEVDAADQPEALADVVPDSLVLAAPKNVLLVFRELEKYRDAKKDAEEPAESKADRWSGEVEKVADLVAGRTIVLIGGQVRPPRRDALMRAFRLADLDWLSTPEHTSITYFEPNIARPETVAVLLAIRWSNHDYAEVQQYCEKYGKLLVRLPAGYHPNQVAHQILNQVGDQLAAAREKAG